MPATQENVVHISYPSQIECTLAEIRGIEGCFNHETGRCNNPELAQELMGQLKSNLEARLREVAESPLREPLLEAKCRLKVRKDSRPNLTWLSELEDARYKLTFHCP